MLVYKFIKKFEQIVIMILIVLVAITLTASIFELVYKIFHNIFSGSIPFLDYEQIKEIFGFLLLVLIGFEILETIKSFLSNNQVRIEVILIAAILAIARKVIFINLTEQSGLVLIGLGVVILALTTGYYLVKRTYRDQ